MLEQKKALLLVGSPKKKRSSSDSLGSYLLDKLSKKEYQIDKLNILSSLKNNSGTDNLLKAAASCDILILSFPLYVDSLPAPVIKAFELIAAHREKNTITKSPKMIAIVNCGFPEALHNRIALDICKCFANKVGFQWAGGLALGGGGRIGGKPLEELGSMVRNITKALDIAAEEIDNGNTISQKAETLMEKKIIPSWLYIFIGSMEWKKQAKKFGVKKDLYAKPYEGLS